MKKSLLFAALLFAGSMILLAQTPTTLVSAKFLYDTGVPVSGTVALFQVASPEISLGTWQLDTQGRVSASLTLDPTVQYHAQLLDSTGVVILEIRSIPISSAIAASAIAILPTGEFDVVISKTAPAVATTTVKFVAFAPTVVNFSNPAPSTNPLSGIYKQIDFGSNQWGWSAPWAACPNNNIFFDSFHENSQTFSFPFPQVMTGMQICTLGSGTLTLTSSAGETFSAPVNASTSTTITTNWSRPATTITIGFTPGWELAVSSVMYH